MNHLLLVRFSSLGDVVLTTALLPQIKKAHPNAKISFLTAEPFGEILKGHPLIDDVIVIDRKKDSIFKIRKIIKDLHGLKPIDLLIDLHSSLRSILLTTTLFSVPHIRVNKRTLERNILVRTKKDFLRKEYQVDRISKDIGFFLGNYSREELSLFLGRTDRGVTSLPKFEKMGELGKYFVIAPGASFIPKAWPATSYRELILKLNSLYPEYKIVVVGSKEESTNFKTENLLIVNKIGETSLTQLCSLIENASFVICNDSAVGHIAEAYGRKTISIMGPTDESFGFALHSDGGQTLSAEVSCRPCSTKGNKSCFRTEPFCFTKISANNVLETVKGALS